MRVIIQMDKEWNFWAEKLDPKDNRHMDALSSVYVPIEISEEEFAEYQEFLEVHKRLLTWMEHLYRHQQGLDPWDDSPFHVGNLPK